MSREDAQRQSDETRFTAKSQASEPTIDVISIVEVVKTLLVHRHLFVILPVALVFLMASVTLLLPRTYTTSASFVPFADGSASRAAGLAAQFGISVPGSSMGHSPEFYAELLRSREMLLAVVDSPLEVNVVRGLPFMRSPIPVQGNLVEILEIEKETYGRSREAAFERLQKMVSVSTGRLSGTISITVKSDSPELSHAIADRMLGLLNDFNLQRRQSQASAERHFVEDRLAAAQEELRASENRQQEFLQRNRVIQSPELQFELDRLERDVRMRQQVFTTLSQAYEQARIDEVRNTPVITVVQHPEVPPVPDRRGMKVKGLIALVLGCLLAVVVALGNRLISSARRSDADEFEELEVLKRKTLADLRRPWRLLGPPTSSERATVEATPLPPVPPGVRRSG